MLLFHVVSSSLVASQLSIKISKPETLAMVLTANDRGPHSSRGAWPAGSVDASWLTFGSFLRCSCEAFPEQIRSQELLETCLKHLETIYPICSFSV